MSKGGSSGVREGDMSTVSFWVDGTPKAQPRPRAFARGGRARVYDPGTAEGWKGLVALAARRYRPEDPIVEPVRLRLDFVMPRTKALQAKRHPDGPMPHTKKPDVDNCTKAVMDCLTDIGMWRDDSLVYEVVATKNYAERDGRPGVRVRIEWPGHLIGDVLTAIGGTIEEVKEG